MLERTGLDQYIVEAEHRYYSNKLYRRVIECLVVIVTVVAMFSLKGMMAEDVQVGIANKIIRFHVLANSDTQQDQALKLNVKKEVVEYLQGQLQGTSSKEEAKQVMLENMDQIQQIAMNKIHSEGYDYEVRVEIGNTYFPTKVYGDLTFPEGEYEALRVLIGKAEGKNWWCVLFPSLCMVNETYSIVPEESKDTLKNVLTEEEYEELEPQQTAEPQSTKEPQQTEEPEQTAEPQQTKDTKHVEYHFAIVDYFSNIFSRIFK